MSLGALSAISAASLAGFSPDVLGALGAPLPTAGTAGPAGAPAVGSVDFGEVLSGGMAKLDASQKHSDDLAVQAATGELKDVHEYTMAATQAQLTTELTVTLRNKALDAFTEIMRMQG